LDGQKSFSTLPKTDPLLEKRFEAQKSSLASKSSGSEEAQPMSFLELLIKYYPESCHGRQIKVKMT
jgi:hypothetical protein